MTDVTNRLILQGNNFKRSTAQNNNIKTKELRTRSELIKRRWLPSSKCVFILPSEKVFESNKDSKIQLQKISILNGK